jgi:hypothetical protein
LQTGTRDRERKEITCRTILEAEAQEVFRDKQHLALVAFDLEKANDTSWRNHIARILHKNFTEDRTFMVIEVRKNHHRQRSGPRSGTKRHVLPERHKQNG